MNKKITLEEIEEYKKNLEIYIKASEYFASQGIIAFFGGSNYIEEEKMQVSMYRDNLSEITKELNHRCSNEVLCVREILDILEKMKKAVAETTTSQQNVE